MTTEKCGCDVQFTARVHGKPVIIFCALHSAAPELLQALRGLTRLVSHIEISHRQDTPLADPLSAYKEAYQKAKQAIANAEKTEQS